MKFKFVCLIVVFLLGCQNSPKNRQIKITQEESLMGTYIRLDICTTPQERNRTEAAFQKAWERLERISWQMNVYDERSDVTKINESSGAKVVIRPDTYFVLKNAQMFWDLTEKTFDITVWPLIELWRKAADRNQLPTQEEIEVVKERVGLGHLKLLGNNLVQFDQPGVQIDLGGIAKGYAIDEVARIFREHQLRHFYIDAGGDVYAGGVNCEGDPWRIGITNPQTPEQVITVLNISDKAVATSGNYTQYLEIEGKRFSHIINPITGYPQKDVTSATVVADSAQSADALATALAILGAERGTALIHSSSEGYESLILTEQEPGRYQQARSKNFKDFEKIAVALL